MSTILCDDTSDDAVAAVILGDSAPTQRVREFIARVAPTPIPVLIQGPTGAGKELVAQALHRVSGRRGAFVAFNVCAIAETMFEDALFGHVRGAFSGAIADAPGFLAEASQGTAFFDEIGGLPVPMQAKLLRAIETGEFRPVGARRDRRSDFRLVAAANDDLAALVQAGHFRADLKFRLSAAVVHVPALDERRDDIPLLARHFARQASTTSVPFELTDGAIRYLQSRAWPGNVRELKHVVECAMAFATTSVIRREDVAAVSHVGNARDSIAIPDANGERQRLIALLERYDWNVAHTAVVLGVHRVTLFRWLRRLGIQRPTSPLARVALTASAADHDRIVARSAERSSK
jgi:DNA-binding NtrC family response regulator